MGILLEELHTSNNTHKHTHTSMSSAHAPQNLPADLNESSQQHELADGCDDADTYLSASLTRCLFFLSSQSLSFFWGSLVVHTSDLSLGSDRIAYMGFCIVANRVFLSVRDQARDPRTSVSRDAKRDAPVSRLCSLGERPRKAGGVRAFWLPLVFFHPHLRSRWNLVSRDVGQGCLFHKKKKGGPTEFDALCKMLLSKQHIK